MPEDIMKLGSITSRTILGFILKKFLEGKFGVKFSSFDVNKCFIALNDSKTFTKSGNESYLFNIEVTGEIEKGYIMRLINKEINK